MSENKKVTARGVAVAMLFLSCVLCSCGDSREKAVLIGRSAGSDAVASADAGALVTGSEETSGQATPENGKQDFQLPGNGTAQKECAEAPQLQQICVYVCGAVHNPGVVTLRADSRVEAALQAAGGFTQDADRDYVNLADWVKDGAQIYFPTEEETKALTAGVQSQAEIGAGSAIVFGEEYDKVNINTAGQSELCTLPGIGEARALDIISYRERNGAFRTTEDIMKVSGIKNSVYEKIKDKITVQ